MEDLIWEKLGERRQSGSNLAGQRAWKGGAGERKNPCFPICLTGAHCRSSLSFPHLFLFLLSPLSASSRLEQRPDEYDIDKRAERAASLVFLFRTLTLPYSLALVKPSSSYPTALFVSCHLFTRLFYFCLSKRDPTLLLFISCWD